MVIYFVLFGRVTVLLRANSVIATASLSPETFRVIEKAVQTANATCAFESWVTSTVCVCHILVKICLGVLFSVLY